MHQVVNYFKARAKVHKNTRINPNRVRKREQNSVTKITTCKKIQKNEKSASIEDQIYVPWLAQRKHDVKNYGKKN